MKKTDNSGYTLVEILTVVAILTLLVGTAGVSISLAYSRDAEKSAKLINDAMETARMYALSKKGSFTLEIDFENHLIAIPEAGEEEDLPSRLKLYLPEDANIKKVSVTFDKAAGKVREIQTDKGGYGGDLLCITSENTRGKKASVLLIRNTGKHYVEYE